MTILKYLLQDNHKRMSSDSYEWRKKWRLEPSVDVDQEYEKTDLYWDIKITPEGEPRIIEYSTHGTAQGFETAFRHGSIEKQLDNYSQGGELKDFMLVYTAKDSAHEILDGFMPELLEESDVEDLGEDHLVVAKPRNRAGGRGVEVMENYASEYDSGKVIERFTRSKGLEAGYTLSEKIDSYNKTMAAVDGVFHFSLSLMALHSGLISSEVLFLGSYFFLALSGGAHMGFRLNGVKPSNYGGAVVDWVYEEITGDEFVDLGDYDGCMRYVNGIELDEDGLVIEDLGGYWRTAEEPKDSEVDDLNRKYLANYKAGKPVEASDEDLIKAQNTAVEAVEALYRSWLEEKKGHKDVEIVVEEL